MQARAVALKTRPEGMPTADNFQIIDIDVPEPQDGEIQVENICMSVDPYMRGRMYDRKSYVPPFQIGEALTGGSIGKVSKSAHPDFQPEIMCPVPGAGVRHIPPLPRASSGWARL